MRSKREGKICVVLGGGGARGLAHLGVLQVLEREEIPVDCLVGTSVGAVVGACYATTPDAFSESRRALAYFRSAAFAESPFKKLLLKSDDVERNFFTSLVASVKRSYVFSNLLRRMSIFQSDRLLQLIADLVPDKTFADCKVPFAVPALDLGSGEEILIRGGRLHPAVLASCSLPGFFPPVELQGRLLADAGVIGPVPVSAARQLFEPSVVIAVDISTSLDLEETYSCGLDVILRTENIASARLNALEIEKADVVIQPDVGRKYWSDFSDLASLVTEGLVAAESKLGEIRDAIGRSRRKSFFWNPLTY